MQDEPQNPLTPEDEHLPEDGNDESIPEETNPAEIEASEVSIEVTDEPSGVEEELPVAVLEEASVEDSEPIATADETSEESPVEESALEEPVSEEPAPRKKRVRENPDVKKAQEQFEEMIDESEVFFDKASRISEEISAEVEVKDKVFERKNIAYEIEAATEEPAQTETESAEDADEDKPDWKRNAEKIYEARSSRKQQMIEERRQMDEIVREKQRKREEALRTGEKETRERILEDARKRREEKDQAFQDMMQRAREENERKRRAALGLEPIEPTQQPGTGKPSDALDARTSRLAKDEDES